MKIWLVTTGSSDVQLKTAEYWDDWVREIKDDYYRLPFKPQQAIANIDEPYRIAPRVLSLAYLAQPEEVWQNLELPLLGDFTDSLKDEVIDKIVLLLTDQQHIFNEDQRDDLKCPYWQDTCELQPIFKRFFEKYFPNAELITLHLIPMPQLADNAGDEKHLGLDDWDYVLKIVRDTLYIDKIPHDPDTVYVSHQAGTPAISSAVQFVSLARFRTKVQFLVINEYNRQTRTISSSTYLRGIQLQEAEALLNRYDYAGVRDILGLQKKELSNSEERIQALLEAGIQWNLAEFHDFKESLINLGKLRKGEFIWWQSGYESAYLAWVRLKQGATVDALFHSFRAVEGTAIKWAEKHYQQHTIRDKKKGLQLKSSIIKHFPSMESWFKNRNSQQGKEKIGLYGKSIFALLKEATDWQTDQHIKVFCKSIDLQDSDKDIFEWRNNLFHCLEGLQKKELFDAWDTVDDNEWITRVIGCLNFVSSQKQFKFPEDASLMAQVHEELRNAIAAYKLQS